MNSTGAFGFYSVLCRLAHTKRILQVIFTCSLLGCLKFRACLLWHFNCWIYLNLGWFYLSFLFVHQSTHGLTAGSVSPSGWLPQQRRRTLSAYDSIKDELLASFSHLCSCVYMIRQRIWSLFPAWMVLKIQSFIVICTKYSVQSKIKSLIEFLLHKLQTINRTVQCMIQYKKH